MNRQSKTKMTEEMSASQNRASGGVRVISVGSRLMAKTSPTRSNRMV